MQGASEEQVKVTLVPANSEVSGQISKTDIQKAKEVAADIFKKAGIEIEWETNENPSNFRVAIRLDGDQREKKDEALGSALPTIGSGKSAAVFLVPARQVSDRSGVPADVVLGAALAHEMLHLILRTTKHTNGVFSRNLDDKALKLASQGRLTISPEDAEKIRTILHGTLAKVDQAGE